jgi:tetratricopeptide (TPR) repeat protein
MAMIHQDADALRRLFGGETTASEADHIAAHLFGCADCRKLAARAIGYQEARGGVWAEGATGALLELYKTEQRMMEEFLVAKATWLELRQLAPKARREKVRLTRSLHTLSFCEALLSEAANKPPDEGEELFYLAYLATQQLPANVSAVLKNEMAAECCMGIGNARRRAAKWQLAREAISRADAYRVKGSGGNSLEGRILCVAGAIEADLGNVDIARKTLGRAIDLFEAVGQRQLVSRTNVQLANVIVDVDASESLRLVERELGGSVASENPRLKLFAEGIRVESLINLGLPREALIRYLDSVDIYAEFREPFIQVRRHFTAARILERLGNIQKAEVFFMEVLAGDSELGLIRELFLDLVYLFGMHLRIGQAREAIAVCQRARQELSILAKSESSDPAACEQMHTVWKMLEDSVREGVIGIASISVMQSYVKAHWRSPARKLPSFPLAEKPNRARTPQS